MQKLHTAKAIRWLILPIEKTSKRNHSSLVKFFTMFSSRMVLQSSPEFCRTNEKGEKWRENTVEKGWKLENNMKKMLHFNSQIYSSIDTHKSHDKKMRTHRILFIFIAKVLMPSSASLLCSFFLLACFLGPLKLEYRMAKTFCQIKYIYT